MYNCKQNGKNKFNWWIAAIPLVVSGSALNPATAASVPSSYLNDYRFCTARLVALNISTDAVSTSCAAALYPKRLGN